MYRSLSHVWDPCPYIPSSPPQSDSSVQASGATTTLITSILRIRESYVSCQAWMPKGASGTPCYHPATLIRNEKDVKSMM